MPPIRLPFAAAAIVLGLLSPAAPQLRSLVVADGLNQPLGFVQDPVDPAVQYVVEQGGRIRVLDDGVLRANDFLDLSQTVVSGGEQGLLGLAFAPDYAASGRFYVNFTNRSGDTVIARFRRSAANRLVADAASRLDLQWSTGERVIRQPFANHNGGQVAFGPDRFLYIGMGDGGSGNDPGNRAQDGATLLGKMLRIDVSVPDGDSKGFRVPPDNPYVGRQAIAALPEIWSFGLRNPWRFSFDDPARGGTGAIVIGDVGQNAYEEIDYEPPNKRGRNYGWRIREGSHLNVTTAPPAFSPLADPVFQVRPPRGDLRDWGVRLPRLRARLRVPRPVLLRRPPRPRLVAAFLGGPSDRRGERAGPRGAHRGTRRRGRTPHHQRLRHRRRRRALHRQPVWRANPPHHLHPRSRTPATARAQREGPGAVGGERRT